MQTIDYEYDALSRLLEASYNGGATVYTYGYDLAGNLTNMEGQTRTYNAANQLTSGGATYDDNGNLTSDGVNAHTWDRANRLLSMGGISYAYDGLGNRVSQTANSVVTQYLLDVQPSLSVVLTKTTPSGVTRYVHGPQGIQAHQDHSGNWAWYVQDGLGSIRGEVAIDWPDLDVNGTKMYTPYGNPFGEEGSFASSYGFTGEQTDTNDLVYLRARYLNPELGVFASVDPVEGEIRRAMSLNGYSWVEGNAINLVDASGEISTPFDLCNELIECPKWANKRFVNNEGKCCFNYYRSLAVNYAKRYNINFNSKEFPVLYIDKEGKLVKSAQEGTLADCANFVSQSMLAGNHPPTSLWTLWSSAWTVAPRLSNYLRSFKNREGLENSTEVYRDYLDPTPLQTEMPPNPSILAELKKFGSEIEKASIGRGDVLFIDASGGGHVAFVVGWGPVLGLDGGLPNAGEEHIEHEYRRELIPYIVDHGLNREAKNPDRFTS